MSVSSTAFTVYGSDAGRRRDDIWTLIFHSRLRFASSFVPRSQNNGGQVGAASSACAKFWRDKL
jgi:hypothetical protein